ncbi:unnamed protein product [Prunus armeniaca]
MSAATTTINSATRRNFISLIRVFPPTGRGNAYSNFFTEEEHSWPNCGRWHL